MDTRDTQPIITLTTDFGGSDGYIGSMKGAILGICPAARLIDLSHAIGPRDILSAALLLQSTAPHFPEGTIHLAVVDPGVGTGRKAVALQTPQATFVGPDNGLFGLVWRDAVAGFGKSRLQVVELTESCFFMEPVSATFHGRDVFAPVAAHLACGVELADFGPPVSRLVPAPFPEPVPRSDGGVSGEVVAVDNFGNCITNLPREEILRLGKPAELRIEVCGQDFGPLRRTYADAEPGQVLALIGSSEHLELSMRDGNLSSEHGIARGEAVVVHKLS